MLRQSAGREVIQALAVGEFGERAASVRRALDSQKCKR
jgi:hypothetical protein